MKFLNTLNQAKNQLRSIFFRKPISQTDKKLPSIEQILNLQDHYRNKQRADNRHNITESNFNLILQRLQENADSAEAMWLGRSILLLVVAYQMARHIQKSSGTSPMTIGNFMLFLELDSLHKAMIAYGGNSIDCDKAVSGLKRYLISLPGFNNTRWMDQPKKTKENHGYLVTHIVRAMNDISYHSEWVD